MPNDAAKRLMRVEKKRRLLASGKQLTMVRINVVASKTPTNDNSHAMNYKGGLRKILDKSVSDSGLVSYTLRWNDGSTTKEPARRLSSFSDMLEAYEHNQCHRRPAKSPSSDLDDDEDEKPPADDSDSDDYQPSNRPAKKVMKRPGRRRPGRPRRTQAPDISSDVPADISPLPFSAVKRRRTEPSNTKEFFELRPMPEAVAVDHLETCHRCLKAGVIAKDGTIRNTNHRILLPCWYCSASIHPACSSADSLLLHKHARSNSLPGTSNTKQSDDTSAKLADGTDSGTKTTPPPCPPPRKQYYYVCSMCQSEKRATANQYGTCYKCHQVTPPDTATLSHHETDEADVHVTRFLHRCRFCDRAFHQSCQPGQWPPHHLWENRNTDHTCETCQHFVGKVDKILAWYRVATNDEPIQATLPATDGSDMTGLSQDDDTVTFDPVGNHNVLLVKWENVSYRHLSWVPQSWLAKYSKKSRYYFDKQKFQLWQPVNAVVPRTWCKINRIMDVDYNDHHEPIRVLANFHGLNYADVIWDTIPFEKDLMPSFKNAYKRFMDSHTVVPVKRAREKLTKAASHIMSTSFENNRELKVQPDGLPGSLLPHQLDGVNWLLYQWECNKSCILADDMGLGKTIQVIVFLKMLYTRFDLYPFLIIVPNSVLTNWVREFEKWAPEMHVVPVSAAKEARKLVKNYELFREGYPGVTCHVVIMTYESALADKKIVNALDIWPSMIVDEGHRLKSQSTSLFKRLETVKSTNRILLTGTPVQNNIRELLTLAHFLNPREFHNVDKLADEYAELDKAKVQELHEMLKPYFLRRTKDVVLTELPPKKELIVPVTMTALQKELYKATLLNGVAVLAKLQVNRSSSSSLTKVTKSSGNTLMELRKILNHPYILHGIEVLQETVGESIKAIVAAGAKLKLLHIMLPELIKRGHRVLLFSTMVIALDVIEDYLTLVGIKHVRLDGSTSQEDRTTFIDLFNEPESEYPVFLLTSRAGGMGINLTSADTVIIYDSDFNPHIDLQAISRAHRFGQTKPVLVMRLVTRASAEEKILQVAKKKMVLDHLVVEKMDDDNLEQDDVESILKFGAKALFEEDGAADEIVYDEAAVAGLLDRDAHFAEINNESAPTPTDSLPVHGPATASGEPPSLLVSKTSSNISSELLSFSFARIWQSTSKDSKADQDGDVWAKLLEDGRNAYIRQQESSKETLGRGARKRKAVSYGGSGMRADNDHVTASLVNIPLSTDTPQSAVESEDEDYQVQDDSDGKSEYETDEELEVGASQPKSAAMRTNSRVAEPSSAPTHYRVSLPGTARSTNGSQLQHARKKTGRPIIPPLQQSTGTTQGHLLHGSPLPPHELLQRLAALQHHSRWVWPNHQPMYHPAPMPEQEAMRYMEHAHRAQTYPHQQIRLPSVNSSTGIGSSQQHTHSFRDQRQVIPLPQAIRQQFVQAIQSNRQLPGMQHVQNIQQPLPSQAQTSAQWIYHPIQQGFYPQNGPMYRNTSIQHQPSFVNALSQLTEEQQAQFQTMQMGMEGEPTKSQQVNWRQYETGSSSTSDRSKAIPEPLSK
ncbi:hypothetical protein DM01DRAFT_1322748 [Hesseltinella vesiculosa]|uniref:P-loop containing nucleoside triphosphate hydrolase protein n=1 Tax=Hesseltinella vesiculosa TaxID=101127 RepID=A0A1X2GG16_9FUNG|nr:hypothetical protein DM01DRAFT_1322748 [Hesseltinella vesiculosa]